MTGAPSNPTDSESVVDGREDDCDSDIRDESVDAGSWAVSVCFWGTLLLAGICYGAVFLSPKLADWNQVRYEYHQNAQKLIELESDVDYLERVTGALETDPEFVRRLSGHVPGPDGREELIPVSGNLLFGYEDGISIAEAQAASPPFQKLITGLATNRMIRKSMLSFSALLIIFAFTFLNDAGTNLVYGAGRIIRAAIRMPGKRYLQPKGVADEPGRSA